MLLIHTVYLMQNFLFFYELNELHELHDQKFPNLSLSPFTSRPSTSPTIHQLDLNPAQVREIVYVHLCCIIIFNEYEMCYSFFSDQTKKIHIICLSTAALFFIPRFSSTHSPSIKFRGTKRAVFPNVSLSSLSTLSFPHGGRVVDSQCKTDYFEVILSKNKLYMAIISMILVK